MNTWPHTQTQDPAPILLCFAHRAEARALLKEWEFKAFPDGFGPLSDGFETQWQGLKIYALITAEGVGQARTKLSLFLGQLWPTIPVVVNYGVAAGLRDEVELKKIYSIKTVYAQKHPQEMQFHSFQLQGEYDLVSASERVLNQNSCEYLSAFAPVADRELWGICQAAQLVKAPVHAFKWISDRPYQQTDQGAPPEICQRVKEQSEEFGQAFSAHFKTWSDSFLQTSNSQGGTDHEERDAIGLLDHPDTHFSTTQKRQYLGLLKTLKRKDEKLLENYKSTALELIKQNVEQNQRPKKITPELIQVGLDLLSPFEKQLRQKLENLAAPLSSAGAQVSFDPLKEKAEFTLKAHIQHPRHLQQLKMGLENFSYEDFEAVMKGRDDV